LRDLEPVLEPFTPEDAEALMSLINNMSIDESSINTLYGIYTLHSVQDLDLDALASSLHGITDPIGQLRDWFYDRLKELTSWFSDAVNSLISTFWDTVARPIIDGIKSTVDSIWSYIQRIPGAVTDIVTWITDQINSIWSWIQDNLITPLSNALTSLSVSISSMVDTVVSFFTVTLPDLLSKASSTIQDLMNSAWSWIQQNIVTPLSSAFQNFIDLVSSGIETVTSFFTETLPSLVSQISTTIQDVLAGAWSWIEINIITPLANAFQSFINMVSQGFESVKAFFTETLPGLVNQALTSIQNAFSGVWDWIQRNLITPLSNAFQDFIKLVSSGIETVKEFFTKTLPNLISQFPTMVQNALAGAWSWIQENLITPLSSAFQSFINLVGQGFETVKSFFTETLPKLIDEVGKELSELPSKVLESLTVAGMTIWQYITELGSKVSQGFAQLGKLLERATQYLDRVGAVIMGFVNAVSNLPSMLYEKFKPVIDAFEKLREAMVSLWEGVKEFFEDPWKWLSEHVLTPALEALQQVGEKIWGGIEWFSKQIIDWASKAWNAVTSKVSEVMTTVISATKDVASKVSDTLKDIFRAIVIEPLKKSVSGVSQAWFEALGVSKGGEVSLMFDIAWRFLWEYWTSTLLLYVLTSLFRAIGDYTIDVAPAVFGTKVAGITWRVKLSEVANALAQGVRDFLPSFLIGSFVGIGSTLMRPVEYAYRARFVSNYEKFVKEMYGDVLKEEIEKGAIINMFVESPGLSEIKDWIRRQLVLTEGTKKKEELNKLVATMRAHLKLFGLPRWYIDYLSDTGEKLIYKFVDRFGMERTLFLSTIFELPTHSEMARMTQRDVFPGVDVMKRLGWIRGWNEDLTTLVYLMTFKYPSFEKLWSFYMRAVSGLLWFSPPDTIRQVFTAEAKEIGAGKPVAPLDIQKAIKGANQLKAFELALNTYFKWLEYSNFSWFTENTTMYGIPIGREIYNALGGWVADSWLMADVSADIPTKIDMRWMSRYGIFLYMAKKFEGAGVKFESYAPLVTAVPRLMEANPTSPIQVDLRWFSKLIQATGLHPAWVPIVTVAENIMAISDEMTLLRTGWLNLFKEGLLKVKNVEEYLAGLLIASYKVGYWDPEAKVWRTGWINLPVRWLPHERRLLQLRMSIDRILDIYREFYKYVSSGVRTLAITAEEAMDKLKKVVGLLNLHYSKLTAEITGKEMKIEFDKDYIELWLSVMKEAQIIEVKERIRYWWLRVSGWILYRVAYGYVTSEDIERLAEDIKKYVPLHEDEIEAFKSIASILVGIARKEYIPTPSQLATLAEYMTIPEDIVEKVFEERRIPEEFKPFWRKYIELRPLSDDFRALFTAYFRVKRYGITIPKELEDKIQAYFKEFNVTDKEKELRELATTLEVLIAESREYIPTPSMLASMAEYVAIPKEMIEKVLKARRVPKEWHDFWLRYIEVRPLSDDVRYLLSSYLRAKRYGVAIPREIEDKVRKIFSEYGVTDLELEIRGLAVLLDTMREAIPSLGTLASMAEYVEIPLDYIKKVLEARRVEQTYAQLWLRYLYARMISGEVNQVVSEFRRLYEYFTVPDELKKKVIDLMRVGGWVSKEIEVFELALSLRKSYRILAYLIPTIRQFVNDARYIPEWESLFNDLLKARGIDAVKYKKQIDYYKKLIRNRMVWRQIAWYRSRVVNAYASGVITKEQMRARLEKLKDYGLSDREIELIMDGAELEKLRIQKIYGAS